MASAIPWSIFCILALYTPSLLGHPSSTQPRSAINATTWLNTTEEILPYCRYEREWYDPSLADLDISECQDAIALLIEEDVTVHGSRPFRWSYPRWAGLDTQVTRANPRRYISGTCVLSIWMRSLAEGVDEEIWEAEPRRKGPQDSDNADFRSLARQAYKVFDECILASGKSQTARGTAGWLPSGAGSSMVVSFWGEDGTLDQWLQGKELEQNLQPGGGNDSNVATA